MKYRQSICILVAVASLFVGGCGGTGFSRQVTLPAWQKNVEAFVRVHGKGDPTVLRDVTIADGRKGYAMLGTAVADQSTDATGVLLGFRQIAGNPSFIYLVGLCEKGTLNDIRLAVLSFPGGKPRWSIGDANSRSVQTYVRSMTQNPPPPAPKVLRPRNFPAPGDVFKLNLGVGRVTAVHEGSGATWSVPVSRSRH